jgi:hypothetical protein
MLCILSTNRHMWPEPDFDANKEGKRIGDPAVEGFQLLCDRIAAQAQARGLTQAALDELLVD